LTFILGSRGEWGYIKPVIDEATKRGHDCSIISVNMANLARYGGLADRVEDMGYQVSGRVLSAYEGDLHATMVKSLFAAGTGVVDALVQLRPDWLVLAGDRAEQLGAAVAGAFTYTPTAHIQAGEVSGNIDDTSRHAIARLAHLHFASNADAADRLRRSGEQQWRIHLTGAPQLDEVRRLADDGEAVAQRLLIPTSDFCLAVFHPITETRGQVRHQMEELLKALDAVGRHCVWILPNNDAGGQELREIVESQSRVTNSIFVNLDRQDYLALMQRARYIIGNSSSGILEAPSLGVPAVNVGRRQTGRLRGANVIDVSPERQSILAGIEIALDRDFRAMCLSSPNPYGDGYASTRIVDILEDTERNEDLLAKRLTI